MSWSYTFHRFEDQTAFEAALLDLNWDGEAPLHQVALDVRGILYKPGAVIGTDPETGEPVHDRVALAGYHVNAAWQGRAMPPRFAAAQIEKPKTPDCEFAGADLVGPALLDEPAPVTAPADPV